MSLTVYTIYGPVFKLWRARRFRLFCETFGLPPETAKASGVRVLDVGGWPRADASKIMTTVPPCARGPCFGRGAETWAECRAVTGAPSSEAAGDQSWPEIMASR